MIQYRPYITNQWPCRSKTLRNAFELPKYVFGGSKISRRERLAYMNQALHWVELMVQCKKQDQTMSNSPVYHRISFGTTAASSVRSQRRAEFFRFPAGEWVHTHKKELQAVNFAHRCTFALLTWTCGWCIQCVAPCVMLKISNLERNCNQWVALYFLNPFQTLPNVWPKNAICNSAPSSSSLTRGVQAKGDF